MVAVAAVDNFWREADSRVRRPDLAGSQRPARPDALIAANANLVAGSALHVDPILHVPYGRALVAPVIDSAVAGLARVGNPFRLDQFCYVPVLARQREC